MSTWNFNVTWNFVHVIRYKEHLGKIVDHIQEQRSLER